MSWLEWRGRGTRNDGGRLATVGPRQSGRLWSGITALTAFALLPALTVLPQRSAAEDGYRLWLRYDRITDEALRASYADALATIVLSTPTGTESATIAAARAELETGCAGLLGLKPVIRVNATEPAPGLGE